MRVTLRGQDISQLVSGVWAEKSLLSPAGQLRLHIIKPVEDYYMPRISPNCGDKVTAAHADFAFSGRVERVEYGAQAAQMTVICYDQGIKLCTNEIYGLFSGSAGEIVRQVCKQVGIACGSIWEGAQAFVPPGCSMTAMDIINAAYSTPISAFVNNDRLEIHKPGQQHLVLKHDVLIDVRSGQSLEKLVNRVEIRGYSGRRDSLVRDEKAIAQFGERGRVMALSGAKSSATSQAMAAIVKTQPFAELVLPGDTAILCGSTVEAASPNLGVGGQYIVTYVRHSFEDGLFLSYVTLEGTR